MEPSLFDELDPEQKEINDKYTIDELFKRSLNYKSSKNYAKFFNFIASFHHYSRYNTMLVYIQNPDVTFFGGTTFWKNRNRTINEDAKPLLILCPNGPMMCAYDIYQTSGKKSVDEFLKDGLGTTDIKGFINQKLYDGLLKEVANWGIKIKFKPFSFFKGGHITTIISGRLEIVLKENATIEESFSVLIHELAHLFLGHTGHQSLNHISQKKPMKLLSRKIPRATEELEAETVSFLICCRVGLLSNSQEYLAGYIKNEKDLAEFNYELVIKTADKLEKLFL
ncbi:M78 family metallopeptidase domain-containing protein [Flavobacterium nackdongense]|jgi:hypothetical protein|uniref:ImmA/IrrE family metallo-endopeptidase n=1 Tax=Flavobacterium nackdongense TaxID=2547394 RepID=A0A4P6Y9R1_9FLAO|nr:hypothetical protein [Flavobacterium nackdongense]QBN17267.1 hypothetical protein E1750_00085 [Flavobacterium nackdongense]